MCVLVAGGAGLIGSQLAEALLPAGHEVLMLDPLDPCNTGGRTSVVEPMKTHGINTTGLLCGLAAAEAGGCAG